MEATTAMVSYDSAADREHLDLTQMASLSINEAQKPEAKGEVKRDTVLLNSDIWYMVFAELFENNPIPSSNRDHRDHLGRARTNDFENWLRACRLVSQEFNTIVKPLGYGFVDMSGPLMMDRLPNVSGAFRDSFLDIVKGVTTTLELPCTRDFDFETHASQLIQNCQKLKRVQFENRIQPGSHSGYLSPRMTLSYMASLWLSSFLNNKRKPQDCCISVNSTSTTIEQVVLPCDDEAIANGLGDGETRSSIARLTISFAASAPFRYISTTQVRLPAMHRLFLENYTWQHPAKEFDLMWDFSELWVLHLEGMDLIEFFTQVPLAALWQLELLEIEEPIFSASGGRSVPERQETIRTIMRHVFNCLINLRFLEISCDRLHIFFPVDVISGVLEDLEILELVGDYEEQHISLTSLQEIFLKAKNIESITLEFSAVSADGFGILRVLAQTPNLRHVELRMYACNLGVVNGDYRGTDPDYDAAEAILRYVHSQRLGASLKFRLWVRRSSPPPAWTSVDGKDWCSSRLYKSDIDSDKRYEQYGSRRIGGRKTGQAMLIEDGVHTEGEAD